MNERIIVFVVYFLNRWRCVFFIRVFLFFRMRCVVRVGFTGSRFGGVLGFGGYLAFFDMVCQFGWLWVGFWSLERKGFQGWEYSGGYGYLQVFVVFWFLQSWKVMVYKGIWFLCRVFFQVRVVVVLFVIKDQSGMLVSDRILGFKEI